MDLNEILQNEVENVNTIFLYKERGAWYAYERSAFYCYSLLGVLEIDWLTCSSISMEEQVIRVRISNPDKFLQMPLLKLLKKRKRERTILCRILCGGFFYWREEQKMKCKVLWGHSTARKELYKVYADQILLGKKR